jgi:hypothetical protein
MSMIGDVAMSKAFLVFAVLVFSLSSLAAEQADTSSPDQFELSFADQACLEAITYLIGHEYERSDRPLSEMAQAYVRRCNGHPNKAACEIASQAMVREYGKTPLTCGSDTADYKKPVIMPEHPLLVRPDYALPRK